MAQAAVVMSRVGAYKLLDRDLRGEEQERVPTRGARTRCGAGYSTAVMATLALLLPDSLVTASLITYTPGTSAVNVGMMLDV